MSPTPIGGERSIWGVGMILCVGAEEAADASEILAEAGEPHFPIGAVVPLKKGAKDRVHYV